MSTALARKGSDRVNWARVALDIPSDGRAYVHWNQSSVGLCPGSLCCASGLCTFLPTSPVCVSQGGGSFALGHTTWPETFRISYYISFACCQKIHQWCTNRGKKPNIYPVRLQRWAVLLHRKYDGIVGDDDRIILSSSSKNTAIW